MYFFLFFLYCSITSNSLCSSHQWLMSVRVVHDNPTFPVFPSKIVSYIYTIFIRLIQPVNKSQLVYVQKRYAKIPHRCIPGWASRTFHHPFCIIVLPGLWQQLPQPFLFLYSLSFSVNSQQSSLGFLSNF